MNAKIDALARLEEIVETLRSPAGCPWDRAQTLADMPRYLAEEVAEVTDAIEEAGGRATPEVCEELGDLLMNIFLSARISEEGGAFSLADVAGGIAEKLVRRHPHVFGDATARDVGEVLARWNAIKQSESGGKSNGGSRLDRVPRTLPPLLRAFALGKEAARVGFDWDDAQGAFEKVREELAEVGELLPGPAADLASDDRAFRARLEAELGDLLFAVANLCRKLDVSPDVALRGTLREFCRRFRYLEDHHPDPSAATPAELEATWQRAKQKRKPH